MAQVSVTINGFTYSVGCEDGQEAHLLAMADQVQTRIRSIKALGGQSGEARLLVLASLLMADELHDLTIEANSLRSIRHQPGSKPLPQPVPAPVIDPRLLERLDLLAERAEEIADMLEST